LHWDDTGLTFTATKWELIECSLVAVPADASASVRSLQADSGKFVWDDGDVEVVTESRNCPQFIIDVRARMWARQRMVERMCGRPR